MSNTELSSIIIICGGAIYTLLSIFSYFYIIKKNKNENKKDLLISTIYSTIFGIICLGFGILNLIVK